MQGKATTEERRIWIETFEICLRTLIVMAELALPGPDVKVTDADLQAQKRGWDAVSTTLQILGQIYKADIDAEGSGCFGTDRVIFLCMTGLLANSNEEYLNSAESLGMSKGPVSSYSTQRQS